MIGAYDGVMKQFGRLDCMIANAGLPPTSNSTLDLATKDYHAFLGVAMHGAFYTLREGARLVPGGHVMYDACVQLGLAL